jgi:hypothetical protein
MPEIGKISQLEILREAEAGLYLDGEELGEILLPRRYVLEQWGPGDTVEVFIMRDSEDRLVAITEKPMAMVGEFAFLRVVAITEVGAFLDWGLSKDLLVPFREQRIKMQEGRSYVVHVYLDERGDRIVASSKLDQFLGKTAVNYSVAQAVDLLISQKTDLGFKAIINGTHWGMLFKNNVFRALEYGQRVDGFIQEVREDGKISLTLEKPGYEKVPDVSRNILAYIEAEGGFMPINDKSPSEEITARFGVSKKTFKKAIGALYKARKITIEDDGTRLLDNEE